MLGLNHTKNRLREVWSGRVGDHIIALEWNRDGRLLATAESTGPVTIFDGRTGAQEVRMIGHANGTLAIGWSPTSDLLATSGKDRLARLWDSAGRETASLEAATAWVEHLVWHPDGAILAAVAGKTIHLWDGQGQHLLDLADHPSTVSDLAWKPNSTTLSALV